MIVRFLRPRAGILLGFALGVATALVVFGPRFVFGVGPFWEYPPTDASSHVIGYRMFVQDAWRFPVFYTPTMDSPRGLNVLYMDALPLLAFVGKAIRGLVPAWLRPLWFNPIGAWHAIAYGLQGALGARLLRELVRRSVIVELTGAAFAIATPIFVFRVIHAALTSQFLLLAALLLYVRCVRGLSVRRAVAAWTALFVIAALLQPYLFAMCVPIFAATLGSWATRGRLREALVVGAVPVLAVLTVGLGAGFVGPEVSRGGMWGYGYKTTDLASFFVAQWGTLMPSPGQALKIDMLHAEASEGYAYLGAGVLALVGIGLVRAPRTIATAIRTHKLLAAALVAMACFAVSHRITVGQRVVLELPFPAILEWPARQFRSCGRFIWPLVYASSFYLLALAFRLFESTKLAIVPPLLAAVQFVDTMGAWALVREYTSRGETRFLPWRTVEPLVDLHEGVAFVPSFECIPGGHPIDISEHMELEYIAAKKGRRISSMRSSRPLRDCTRDATDLAASAVNKDDLYALYRPAAPPVGAAHYERHGMTCVYFGKGLACSSHFGTATSGDLVPYSPEIDYRIGDVILLGSEQASSRYLGLGWSYAEGNHRWTLGEAAFLYLRTTTPIEQGCRLRIRAGGAILAKRTRMTMDVRIDGTSVGTAPLGNDLATFEYVLPASVIGTRILEVELRPSEFRPPSSLGEGTEKRALGVSVADIAVVR